MEVNINEYNFHGWATKNDLQCSDGRIIRKDAFKHCDGMKVPLVWNHDHTDPYRVVGHALLENRADGVYAYGKFNETDLGKTAKMYVEHGDITQLSIYANQLKQQGPNVIHGSIREVSLVLAGANPGASIQTVIKHGDETDEEAVIAAIPALREKLGDRAIMRALHFVRENERVGRQAAALKEGRTADFLAGICASGDSSFKYLQNVYTTLNVEEQGLSLALGVTAGVLADKGCAWRVHGGGFAGTIQAFVKAELAEEYRSVMDAVFGEGAVMMLSVRPAGATEIVL